jgi:hypothetical protein
MSKDIYAKGALGTERWDLLRTHRLSRYQWTFPESRPRLRLLALRRELSTRRGRAFLRLAGSGLRLCGVPTDQGLPAVNDVLAHYSGRWLEKPRLRHGLKRIPNEHGNRALCAAE